MSISRRKILVLLLLGGATIAYAVTSTRTSVCPDYRPDYVPDASGPHDDEPHATPQAPHEPD